MKNSIFFTTIASLILNYGYTNELQEEVIAPSSETAMLELEKELLSLEDELLNVDHEIVDSSDDFLPEEENIAPLLTAQENVEATALSDISLEEPETPPPSDLSLEKPEEPDFIESLIEESPTDEALDLLQNEQQVALVEAETIPVESRVESLSNVTGIEISFKQVFAGSPLVYSLLFGMSLASIAICLYSILRIKSQNKAFPKSSQEIRAKLLNHDFAAASTFCQNNPNLLNKMVSSGLTNRKYGLQVILEGMKSEGKRATVSAWQHLGILQDIAIIAPMLGLLGTVIGLFYAFYDLNRSFDSINNLLDGLGISVGTTVAGIGVAILAMLLHSAAKFRLVRVLAKVETEASSLAHLMDEKNTY